MSAVFSPLNLPNGDSLKNRLAKAAMEENMANGDQQPDEALFSLYRAWADGGAGLIITGNVMVDRNALTGPGGVVLDESSNLQAFEQWAQAGKSGVGKLVMQINHPGRQVPANLGTQPLAPSAIALDLGKHSKRFTPPVEMTEESIQRVIQQFSTSAQLAEKAGFDGVEIHAAHGYLLSQFLSPLSNQRTDRWGGTAENRARLLLSILDAVRQGVSSGFIVAVKLNSADFQRGGFDADDARQVIRWLNERAVDLLELSGGSYESPAMQGRTADGRTLEREAYFLRFARELAKEAQMPVMTTGGIRRLQTAEQVLQEGIDVVGMATALAYQPDLPDVWGREPDFVAEIPHIEWKDKTLSGVANMAMTRYQLQRLGAGKKAASRAWAAGVLVRDQWRLARKARNYRRKRQWREGAV